MENFSSVSPPQGTGTTGLDAAKPVAPPVQDPMLQGSASITPGAGAGIGLGANAASSAPRETAEGHLEWVWREVRKRVFLKLPFSVGVADAMEAVVPISLEEGVFVVGLSSRNFPLSCHILSDHVKKTIENILRAAAGRLITLEVVEGTSMEDWDRVRERRSRAQEAVLAAARQHSQSHHYDDMLNQIVGEIRQRVTRVKDRALPQVRAQMLFDIAPTLADAEEMLFTDPDSHDARRAMSRALDRVAAFLDIPPITLAIEVERYRRQPKAPGERPAPGRPNTLDSSPV